MTFDEASTSTTATRRRGVRQLAAVLSAVAATVAFGISCASAQNQSDDEAPTAEASDAPYRIERVDGGLYRFTDDRHHSVFLVTDDGIVVTDPIDTEAANWLKAELQERFDAPVRYVVYSHSHPDHIYGGEVFDEPGVVFVAHRRTRSHLERSRADIPHPDVVFEDRTSIHVGDHEVRLTYHGPNNGRGSISMLFDKPEVMFVVDWIVVGRMPYRDLPGYDLEGMIESTRDILGMEWDTFVGGHADIGDRDDVERYLAYLEALYSGVVDGMRTGKSLEAIKRELTLEEFSDLAKFDDWRTLNIEGAYRQLERDDYMKMRPEVPDSDSDS